MAYTRGGGYVFLFLTRSGERERGYEWHLRYEKLVINIPHVNSIEANKYNVITFSEKQTVISCEEKYMCSSQSNSMLTVTVASPFVRKYTKLSIMCRLGIIIPKLSLRM